MLLLVITERPLPRAAHMLYFCTYGDPGMNARLFDTCKVEAWICFLYIPGDKPEQCINTRSFWTFRIKFHHCFLNVSTLMIWSLPWPNIDVKNSPPWLLYYVWISRAMKQYGLLALQCWILPWSTGGNWVVSWHCAVLFFFLRHKLFE